MMTLPIKNTQYSQQQGKHHKDCILEEVQF